MDLTNTFTICAAVLVFGLDLAGSAYCPKIQLEHGKVELHEDRELDHTYVTIECDKYADLDPPDSRYLACLDDKTWSGTVPVCRRKTCGHLDHPSHGRRLKFNNEPTGITEFECDEGYTMRGRPKLMCMVGGQWKPENPPTCHPVTCPEPEEINHGTKFQEATDGIFNDFGSVVTYTCDKHYEPEGQMRRRCQANGQWEGKTPACIRSASCPKIQLENGKVEYHENPTDHFYVTIVCDENADLDPEDSSYLVCLDDKTWSKSPPHCNRQTKVFILDKEVIEVHSGRSLLNVKNGTSLKHGTKIRQSCRDRYELYKDGYLDPNYTESTSIDGHWEPQLTTCKKKRCYVSTIDNGTPKLSDGSAAEGRNVEHGVIVTTVCDDKFELDPKHNNNAISECGLKQLGQLRLKTCSLKRCDVPEKRDNTVYKSRGKILKRGKIKHGAPLSVTCRNKTEYELVLEKRIGTKSYMKTFNAKCQYGGYLPPDIPHCEERRCDVSHLEGDAYKNSEPVMNRYITSGDSIRVECAHGYRFQGNSKQQRPVTVTCNKGQLDVSVLCEPEPCQVPQIKNSGFSGKEIKHGKKMSVPCNRGYEFKDGSERIYLECSLGDLESDPGIPLECFEKKCRVDQIGSMKGMAVSDTDQKILSVDAEVNSGAVVYPECSKGYESLTDDTRTLVCNLGKWNGTVDCLERGCDIPVIQNAEEIEDYYPDYDGGIKHREQIDIICKEGYELLHKSDRITVTCEFGNWTNLPSGCFAKKCSVNKLGDMSVMNVSGTDGTILPDDAVVDSGDEVHPECIKGYMPLDNNTKTPACNLGEWSGSFACLERRCSTPTIRNATLFRWPKMSELYYDDTLVNGQTIRVICNEKFVIANSQSRDYIKQLTCVDGEWDSEVSCKAKICHVNEVANGEILLGDRSLDNPFIDEGDQIEVKCNRGFEIVHKRSTVLLGFTTTCHKESLRKSLPTCRRKKNVEDIECRYPPTDNYIFLFEDYTKVENAAYAPHGSIRYAACSIRDQETGSGSPQRTTCMNGSWEPKLPPCDSNDVDKATEAGRENQDKSCILPEDNRYKFDDGNRTAGEKLLCGPVTEHNVTVAIVVLSKECANFTNGKVKQSYDFDEFMVTCDEGYSLNISKLQNKFLCDNDVLVNKIYNITASCLPDGCLLPDPLRIRVEKLNQDKSRTGTDLFGGMTVQHGKHVLLNCMTEGYEPKLRTFQCETGKWVPADAGWKGANPKLDNESGHETIGLFPECRKAICEPPCKNFGSCIRDNKCKCPRETQGDQCEKFKCPDCERNGGSCPVSTACVCPDNKEGNHCQNFKCNDKCKRNGGTCPVSSDCVCPDNKEGEFCQSFKCHNQCKNNGGTCRVSTACECPANKYGKNCQYLGCLGSHAKFPSVDKRKELYTDGEVIRDLRCNPGQRLVGDDSSLVCRNGIWQGNVSCEKIKKNRYRIRVVTEDRRKGGTDGDVFLKLYGEYGESEEVELTNDMDGKWNKFERKDTNVFSELLTDVGQIRSIRVRHHPYVWTSWWTSWSLATVAIFDHARNQYYPFFWNNWVYDRKEKKEQITIYPNRADPDCQNRDANCSRFDKPTQCRHNWLKLNCAKYCGYCKIGRFCGDTFTEAFRMRVPTMQRRTTARDIVGCRLKCAEIEGCAAAVYRPGSTECFWLSTEQLMSTTDTTHDDPYFELVYARKLCQ